MLCQNRQMGRVPESRAAMLCSAGTVSGAVIEAGGGAAGLTRSALPSLQVQERCSARHRTAHETRFAAETLRPRRGEQAQPCRYSRASVNRQLGHWPLRSTALPMSRNCSPSISCMRATSIRNHRRLCGELPTIVRVCRSRASSHAGMTPRDLARCVEMAVTAPSPTLRCSRPMLS